MKLEQKQKQWIKEHQYILNLQTPFLNDMLDLESQDIDLEIVNENVQKITNHVVFRVILPFLTLQDFVGMYTINKNFYNFIRKTYSIGGDKKLNRISGHPMLPTLNVPHDLYMKTALVKTVCRFHHPLSALYEYFLDPYEVIMIWRDNDHHRPMSFLCFTIHYEADTHRLHVHFPTEEEPFQICDPIVVDSVYIPGVLVRPCKDSPTEVYRFAWFDLPLCDHIENQAKELYLNRALRVDVIYQNIDIPGQFVTWILLFSYDSSRQCHTCSGNQMKDTPTEEYKFLGRPFMFPEIKNK